MQNEKVIAYAIAYLNNKIREHEEFLNNYQGDPKSLAQYNLLERYKKELQELEYLM